MVVIDSSTARAIPLVVCFGAGAVFATLIAGDAGELAALLDWVAGNNATGTSFVGMVTTWEFSRVTCVTDGVLAAKTTDD